MVYHERMPVEPTLQDRFYEVLIDYYSEKTAWRLAKAHAEAHEQFLQSLGMARGGVRKKGQLKTDSAKKLVNVRAHPNRKRGNIRRPLRRAPNVNHEVVEEEILSYMRSVGADEKAIRMLDIVDGCSGFDFTYAQVRVTVRAMHKKGLIVQEGRARSALYRLPGAKVGADVSEHALSSQLRDDERDDDDATSDGSRVLPGPV